MRLDPKSKLVRWTYFLNPCGPPCQTTLCAFFWRGFVFIPLFWALIVIGIGVLLAIIWLHPGQTAAAVGLIGAFLGTVWLAAQTSSHKFQQSTFVQGVKAIKGKYCPIIYILTEEEAAEEARWY